jgi:hypothetical protein
MLVNIPAPWSIWDRDNPRKMKVLWWKNGGRMDMVRKLCPR